MSASGVPSKGSAPGSLQRGGEAASERPQRPFHKFDRRGLAVFDLSGQPHPGLLDRQWLLAIAEGPPVDLQQGDLAAVHCPLGQS